MKHVYVHGYGRDLLAFFETVRSQGIPVLIFSLIFSGDGEITRCYYSSKSEIALWSRFIHVSGNRNIGFREQDLALAKLLATNIGFEAMS